MANSETEQGSERETHLCGADEIRTRSLLIDSQLLYPVGATAPCFPRRGAERDWLPSTGGEELPEKGPLSRKLSRRTRAHQPSLGSRTSPNWPGTGCHALLALRASLRSTRCSAIGEGRSRRSAPLSASWDSNPQPPAPEAGARPFELHADSGDASRRRGAGAESRTRVVWLRSSCSALDLLRLDRRQPRS